MWLDDASIARRELVLSKPYVNTAGFMGFYPDAKYHRLWQHLGAFITNPISYRSRKPAENRASLPYPGGVLLHGGLLNPGFEVVLKRYALRWGRSVLPIIVHLVAEDLDTVNDMTRRLESCENVAAIELGFSPTMGKDEIEGLISAAQCELPLVVCLTPGQASMMASELADLPLAMLHLGEFRGVLPGKDGSLVPGRLFGPSMSPQAIAISATCSGTGMDIMAGGGVYSKAGAECLFKAGVKVVALDSLLWYGDGDCGDLFS